MCWRTEGSSCPGTFPSCNAGTDAHTWTNASLACADTTLAATAASASSTN